MIHRPATPDHRWQDVALRDYKETPGPHRGVTRQVLFEAVEALPAELRYFEIAPHGHSTLERHAHIHQVLILRGSGRALVGDRVIRLATRDLVHIPALAWHQFRAGAEPLGFLCLVAGARDRPQLPEAHDLEALRASPEIAAFIRT